MAERSNSLPGWQVVVGALLSWIGLAGLADNVVEWKEWFEVGWMQHWRAVKLVLVEAVKQWFGFSLPSVLIDYTVISATFSRAIVAENHEYYLRQREEREKRANAPDGAKFQSTEPPASAFATSYPVQFVQYMLVWPLVVFAMIFLSRTFAEKFWSSAFVKSLLFGVAFFLGFLLVASDLAYQLNLTPSPF